MSNNQSNVFMKSLLSLVVMGLELVASLLNSASQEKTLALTDKKNGRIQQDTSFLTKREKISYAVFTYFLRKCETNRANEKINPRTNDGAYLSGEEQVIFLKDYKHKLSDKYLSLFNNSILPILSAERIDPKKLYGDQKGFHRYTDKVTGLRGFILGINQVKMEGEKQATVIYSYHSNMHSGGSSFATLTNLKNKWEVAKVKGGYKY